MESDSNLVESDSYFLNMVTKKYGEEVYKTVLTKKCVVFVKLKSLNRCGYVQRYTFNFEKVSFNFHF